MYDPMDSYSFIMVPSYESFDIMQGARKWRQPEENKQRGREKKREPTGKGANYEEQNLE